MTLTSRDKVLVLIIPALIVLAVMGYLNTKKFAERLRLESAVEKAQADLSKVTAPTSQQTEDLTKLSALTVKANDIEKQVQDLLEKIGEMETRIGEKDGRIAERQVTWQESTAFTRETQSRNDRIKKLNGIIMRHGLAFVEDSDTNAGKVSQALDALAQRIAQGPDAEKPRLRSVRCVGGYLDMHGAIQEISKGAALGLPVGLTMKATEDPERHEWTLLLWI